MTCLSCLNMTVGLTIIYVNRVARLVFFRPRTSNLAFLILVGLENIEVGLFVKVGSFLAFLKLVGFENNQFGLFVKVDSFLGLFKVNWPFHQTF